MPLLDVSVSAVADVRKLLVLATGVSLLTDDGQISHLPNIKRYAIKHTQFQVVMDSQYHFSPTE
jgi:hypothetical protein